MRSPVLQAPGTPTRTTPSSSLPQGLSQSLTHIAGQSQVSTSSLNSRALSSSFVPPLATQASQPPLFTSSPITMGQQQHQLQSSFPTLTPSRTSTSTIGKIPTGGPNYNISLPQVLPLSPMSSPPASSTATMSVLQPLTPVQAWNSSTAKKIPNNDWGDFDPLA